MPSPPAVDLRNTFGAILIGFLVSTVLFGLTIGQTWIYFWHYWTKDRKALKFFVAFITILDIVLTSLTAYAMYWYLILNFGNVAAGHKWIFTVQYNLSAICSSSVQLFYARRIYVVSQTLFPALVIVIICLAGDAIVFYLAASQLTKTTQTHDKYQNLMVMEYVAIGGNIVADVLVASMMCWALYRKKTGIARTDSLIMTLMVYTTHTGLLMSALATAGIITFMVSPGSLIPEAIFWVSNKCYVNCMLAMLNCRDHVRDWQLPTDISDLDNSYNMTSIGVDPPDDAHGPLPRQGNIPVIVHRPTTNLEPTLEIPKSAKKLE